MKWLVVANEGGFEEERHAYACEVTTGVGVSFFEATTTWASEVTPEGKTNTKYDQTIA